MATPAAVLSIIVEAQTGKAKAELEKFNRTLGDKKVEVKVDFDKSGVDKARSAMAVLTKESNKLGDVFNRSQLSIGQWSGILAASLPVVFDLAGALGALAASLGAATLGVGALGAGLAGLATVGFGGILAIAVPAIKSLGEVITGQEALNKARATGGAAAASSAAAAEKQIQSAREGVTAATRGVTTAEQQLAMAQRSEEIAQDSLTAARKEATRQLLDMKRAAIEGGTSEKRARLSLRQAEASLRELMASGEGSRLDIRDAELSIVEARQNLRDVTIAGNRAQADYNKAQKGGVSQMEGVVSAQQAYADAQRATVTAQQGVADAHREVAKATQALADAQTEANAATGAGATQMAALALAQKKAGPAAVAFAGHLKKMTQAWHGLTRAGREDFFKAMDAGVSRLNRKLPLLAKSANSSMHALRRGFDNFLDRATGPGFDKFIRVMTVTFAKAMGPISRAFGNIAVVLERLSVAVAPDIVRMMRGFNEMTKGWVDSTKNAQDLRDTVHGLVNQANTWWKLIKAVGDLFVAVLAPGADKGKKAIEGITATIKEWTDWVNAHPKEMKDFFKEGLKTTEELARALLSFVPTLLQLSTAMRPIARAFLVLTTALNSIRVGNISALTVLLGLIISTKLVTGAVGLGRSLWNIGSALGNASKAAGGFKGIMQTIALKGMYAKEAIANWSATMLTGIKDTLGKIRERMTRSGKASGMTWGKGFGRAAAVGIAIGIVALGPMIQDKVEGVFGDARKGMRDKLLDPFGQSLIQSWKGFTDSIGKSWRNLKQLIGNQVKAIKGHVGRVIETFNDMLSPIKAAVRWIGNLIRKIKNIPSPGDLIPDLPGGKGGIAGTGIGNNPFNAKGGFVTPQGVVPFQGFAAGGMVGGLRPKGTDTVPAMLTPGEMVLPKHVVDSTRKNAKLTAAAMTGELGKGYKKATKDSDEFRKQHSKTFDKLKDAAKKVTGKFRKTTTDDFQKTGKDADDSTDKMRRNVTDGFQKTKTSSMEASSKMKQGVTEDFRNLTSAVGDGINKIAKMTNTALKALGVKKVSFTATTKDPKGHKRGGPIGGAGVGDKVPAMLEPGEFVVNKKAAARHRGALDHINFKDAPRFQKGGGLDFALGPYTIPPITYDANHAGGNSHVHISGTTKPWIIAIGKKLQQMGWQVGENPAFGGITSSNHAHYTNDHWSGRAIDANTAQDETQTQVAAVARLLRSGKISGTAAAEKVKRILLKGPKGPLTDMGQAALDKVHGAANKYLAKKTPSEMAGAGAVLHGSGDVEKVFARVAKKLSKSRTATLALGEAGFAESGMQDLPGGLGGSQGALQLIPSTAANFGVSPHDEAAIASLFFTTGYGSSGGANKLAAQGLPAHSVAQGVQASGAGAASAGAANYLPQKANALGWMKRFGLQYGGMVEPFVGSFAKGGTVSRDGVAKVHRGEQILPKPELGGMKQTLRYLRSLADNKRERRLIRHIRDSSGNRQLKLLSKALSKMGVNFTQAERKRLRVLARDQRHGGGLTHEEKQELHKLRRERRQVGKENDIKDLIALQREQLVEGRVLRKELAARDKRLQLLLASETNLRRALRDFTANSIGDIYAQKSRNASPGTAVRY